MIQFYMPTKIVDGKGVVQQQGKIIKEYGQRALVVTGRFSSKMNGSLQDMKNTLEKLNIEYQVFDEVEENPSVENVVQGANKYKEADFVIGIGGGSPLDAAKAIAVLLKNPEENVEDVLFNMPEAKGLPVIAVPTTAGTGSEVTPYSILTLHKEETKRNFSCKLFPEVAFIDVRYYLTMNISVRRDTCIDALTHLVESYLNTNASIYSDGIVEAGLALWARAYPNLNKDKISEEAMHDFAIASMFAGIAISQTGTSLPHGMGYFLTYHHGISHGHANGLFIGKYLRLYQDKKKVAKLLSYLEMDSVETFEKKICQLLPTVCLTDLEKEHYVEQMMMNQGKLKNYPFSITKEELLAMY